MAYGELKKGSVIKPLILSLNDEDIAVCLAATKSLRQIEDERIIQPLIELLKDDSAHVREVAATSLGHIGVRTSYPTFDLLNGR